jgi:polar amino acid transport system substrate-binding protein
MVAGCGLPRDPEGTLDRIQGGVLRAGLLEHPPWATGEGGDPTGVEVTLLEGFARDHDARVQWFPGPEEELLRALEHRELDVVVGGLTADNPWSRRFQFARPYFEDRVVVGVRAGSSLPEDLDGMRIGVLDGSDVAALVEERGAVPVRLMDLGEADGPVAGEVWRVRAVGLEPTDVVLATRSHTIAVVPGENALRVALERYLVSLSPEVPAMLEAGS